MFDAATKDWKLTPLQEAAAEKTVCEQYGVEKAAELDAQGRDELKEFKRAALESLKVKHATMWKRTSDQPANMPTPGQQLVAGAKLSDANQPVATIKQPTYWALMLSLVLRSER